MNRNKLKTYAPKARRAFIQAVTARASKFGITASKIEPVHVQGDVALIGGQAFPRKVAEQRRKLEERIALRGFEQVMEEAAYTWFNRFAAIRFMEVHSYLDHGYRVLSHPEGKATPEIIEHAEHIDLPSLDREKVIDLKLDGTKDEELYRMLLMAQCNALHSAMPFLFERIDDETELLLPDHLLHSDSLIRQMVNQIDEADWQAIEIIGWLYQFYISERKDSVIGKVVNIEDIPAATQLFTPNWIVKYLVQNSLGAKWLATYPQSNIMSLMEYYIPPAEQMDKTKHALTGFTPTQLNPEELTLIDPACGSGHILIEAYDLFKEIYLEQGYSLKEIPLLIIEKNVYGTDIDSRAIQLTGFALLMKARSDDARIFAKKPTANISLIQSCQGIEFLDIATRLSSASPSDENADAQAEEELAETTKRLIRLFASADSVGSLITTSENDAVALSVAESQLKENAPVDLMDAGASQGIAAFISLSQQSRILSRRYDCVVANPPYLSSKNMAPPVKAYIQRHYADYKSDLFSCFIRRSFDLAKRDGIVSMVVMQNWMFLSGHERLRMEMNSNRTILSLVQIGYNSFPSLNSKIALASAFSFKNERLANYVGTYINLNSHAQSADKEQAFQARNESMIYYLQQESFSSIPGQPIAYWLSDNFRDIFKRTKTIEDVAPVRQGFQTGDNDRFLRFWHEVSNDRIELHATKKEDAWANNKRWVPYNKGGEYRRWYGNNDYVVSFDKSSYETLSIMGNCLPSRNLYFREAVTWSALTSSHFGARYSPEGFTFSAKGACAFPVNRRVLKGVCALLNSKVAAACLNVLSPTLDFNVGDIRAIPFVMPSDEDVVYHAYDELVSIAKIDWDSSETSWDFQRNPLLITDYKRCNVADSFGAWEAACVERKRNARQLEEQINSLFIAAYGLEAELTNNVPEDFITLNVPDFNESLVEFISYAIGCIVGRYSLSEFGLIYASSRNAGFDLSRYGDFLADEDGIIPITEAEWFSDDAANRFAEFLKVAWSPETLKENLKFVADSLGAKANETPMDAIRRYLSRDFYKDHLKTYKKRPIYWLFSSGKEKAFECLVYLHRYNEGTLSRMRMEYVTPLQGRVSARIEQLDRDIQAAATTAAQNKLRRQQEKLKKQQAELIKFDEELRHYADKRIKLDLDDGVKVNYGKFGNLLAEVKTVTGGSDE